MLLFAFKVRPKTLRFSFCNIYFDFIVIQANLVILALVLKEICRLQTSQRTCMSEIVRYFVYQPIYEACTRQRKDVNKFCVGEKKRQIVNGEDGD